MCPSLPSWEEKNKLNGLNIKSSFRVIASIYRLQFRLKGLVESISAIFCTPRLISALRNKITIINCLCLYLALRTSWGEEGIERMGAESAQRWKLKGHIPKIDNL